MGDVGERSAMDQCRPTLQRLDQIGQQRVLEEERHGPVGLQVGGGDRLLVAGQAHDDPPQAPFEVGPPGGQTKDGHDFTTRHDHEVVFPGRPATDPAQAKHYVAQGPVVHVHRAGPADAPLVEAERVAMMDVAVEHGREEVVGRGDGVEVTGEVQVDLLHGDHLRVPSAGRSTLDAEHRSQRRLPQSHHNVLPHLA